MHPFRSISATRASLLATALRMSFGVSVALHPVAVRGDILRGGATGGAAPPAASGTPSGGAPPAATDQARANARDSLARTTQALTALRAMQQAARDNAIQGPNHLGNHPRTGQPLPQVPNGLGSGGLQIDPRVTTDPEWWQGADLPSQSAGNGSTNVTVKQTAQQALLHWETFNVGKETTVKFDQSAGGAEAAKWIAFNKINDPSGNPSQILGSIEAQGQVYLINRNGIIFGGSSQVNTGALTASALPVNDNLIASGLLNNPNQEFLFNGLGQGPIGDVTVRAGARISTPVSADGNGGRIFLTGANVTNEGTLSSPAGQVILASGLQVGIAAHNSEDPSLRGVDVYVGAVVDPASALSPYAGTTTNSGLIEIARASAILTGKSVRHLGAIESSTSIALNGRVDLLANYGAVPNTNYADDGTQGAPFLFRSAGSVTLGSGSVVRILPETESTEKAVGLELALRSQINLQGQTIHLSENSEILAPNARAAIRAGRWASISATPYATFLADGGQAYLDKGAVINLAGTTDATASALQNFISLVLRGSELAVAPLQRDGMLRGDTITVDVSRTGTYDGRDWIGTPLADVSGFAALIERDVAQLTTAGGSLEISAGHSVVIQPGATIDVSGGWTNFTGAMVGTTRLVSNGQIIDIADATPDRIYDSILTATSTIVHEKWGVVEEFLRPLAPSGFRYQQDYTHGADAGAITISAPSMALDGNLLGTTVQGPRQTRSTSTSTNLPDPGTLTLRFQAQILAGSAVLSHFPERPQIIFQDSPGEETVAFFHTDEDGNPADLPISRRETVHLSPSLFAENGFGNLTVENAEGTILLPEDSTLRRSVGGSLTLRAANIDIQGNIIAPGGKLEFTAYNISPYFASLLTSDSTIPDPEPGQGIFTLGPRAVLSTAGLLTDDRLTTDDAPPLVIRGGSVSITAYDALLSHGGLIDVSGGYLLTSKGNGFYGSGGQISIHAGQDPNVTSVLGGLLDPGATLLGYSGARGGTLSLQAGHVRIGGDPAPAGTLHLQPDFFHQGGFATFQVAGLGGGDDPAVLVAPGTVVEPVVKSFRAIPNAPGEGLVLEVVEEIAGLRQAASLHLSAPGVRDLSGNSLFALGEVLIGEDAVLRTDPGGSISATGNIVSVLGSLIAPGGSISVAGSNSTALVFNDITRPLITTYIGPDALLSAAGTTVLLPDPYERRTGTVFAGGNITLGGNIAAEAGAVLDVSGASSIFDLAPAVAAPVRGVIVPPNSGLNAGLQALATVPTRIDSNAGSITLRGGQMLFSDATLLGHAGGPTALGGSLIVSSGRFDPPGIIPPASSVNLTVRQSGSLIPAGAAAIGADLGNAGHFSIDSFTGGGFDSLTLGGVVSFEGAVDITARSSIQVATDGFLHADSGVALHAPHVTIGRAFQPPTLPEDIISPFGLTPYSPTHGTGSLHISAGLIDVGSLSLQNIGLANLIAEDGDIRGSGTFHLAGDLFLRAGQIHPVTATSFSLIAYDHTRPGSISIEAAGSRRLPLSAGGTLNIHASVIHQNGTLRAPFGTINLGWDGTGTAPVDIIAGISRPFPVTNELTLGANSVTSVSAIDPITGEGIIIPFGVSTDGENWIDPRGIDITTGGLPEKSVVLSGRNVTTEEGSLVDLRGGGDLYAYRWVPGLGGPTDILASNNRFAIIPGYDAVHAPVSAFNTSSSSANLIAGNGPGYANSSLRVGDRIYIAGSNTLAEGYYTLLPARYALLPGAVLVTPSPSGGNLGTVEMPDRSSVVSGFRFNSLNGERTLPTVSSRFELASSEVVHKRAEYQDHFANVFLRDSALAANLAVPRLPLDSGQLVFQASQTLQLAGGLSSTSISGGRGSLVDVSTPLDTFITSAGTIAPPGAIVLDAAALNAFGAESLLIGGRRTRGVNGIEVSVRSSSLTVDNAGSLLSASDLILVSRDKIVIADGAELSSTGSLPATDTLHLTGNGALVRLSADPLASVIRTGATSATSPLLQIGAGASLTANSLILDSTSALSLDPAANLVADAYSFRSGRISLLLDQPGALLPGSGLVIDNNFLEELGSARSLSLLSYSSIDLYGSGTFGGTGLANLSLSAGSIQGRNTSGDITRIIAGNILLQNTANAAPGLPSPASSGTLEFQAGSIRLGANQLALHGYSGIVLDASQGIIGEGSGGLSTPASLTAITPLITGTAGAKRSISAGGILEILESASSGTPLTPGLGSTLSLTGSSVIAGSTILLPSGSLSIHALNGNLSVDGMLDVSGTSRAFHDVTRFTNAGEIRLLADHGDVILGQGSIVDLSAPQGGGNAGLLAISIPGGSFLNQGTIRAAGGTGGKDGSFELDAAILPSFGTLTSSLTSARLTESQTIRVRDGDVIIDGLTNARHFSLSADRGNITVTGTIDASGTTGGSIRLAAHGNLTTSTGALLTVAALDFDNAGKGGSITLEAGSQLNGTAGTGTLDLSAGSTLDLSVDSLVSGDISTPGSSASLGRFTGKLHLRAPQSSGDLLIQPIDATITGASSILAEGYRIYDLTASGGAITPAVQTNILNDGIAFLGASGATTSAYTGIVDRLLANNPDLAPLLVLAPGAEIINRTGSLTLGTPSSTTTSDWNLTGFRFGPRAAPGVLTLRAAGDLVFHNALSDGFAPTLASSDPSWLWTARLSTYNPLLPANAQTWSYRFAAGADLAAADFRNTLSPDALAPGLGSLKLGKTATNTATSSGAAATTLSALTNRFQVIRTGSGDIDIHAARDVQLLNHFATIYTAGTRVPDPSLDGLFRLPSLSLSGIPAALGSAQQTYAALYSMAGGDVRIHAGENIRRLTLTAGQLVDDSQFQMPTNWLYRRGYVDPLTGEFGVNRWGESASTTWWIDFSNFFQGVGALGGGNVSLIAGNDIRNVDAVIPTNARMHGFTDSTQTRNAAPNPANLIELGGGDLLIRAGNNLDAGVYYVERGLGTIEAGGGIHTNPTRSVLTQNVINSGQATSYTELPTTLFVGKGGFEVSALGDILLGPVANPFLLPGGLLNSFWHKSYFSTYSADSHVHVSSLGGNVTLRGSATSPGQTAGEASPLLQSWYTNKLLFTSLSAANNRPWLRLSETNVIPFSRLFGIRPATLTAASFSGDVKLAGDITLTPSPTGTIDLLAAGSILALQPNGIVTLAGTRTTTWGTSRINLSDADPAAIPGIASPFGYQTLVGTTASAGVTGGPLFLDFINRLFAESGGTLGQNAVLQTKQALHAPGILHRNDPHPVRLYAGEGDITGLTLFSPKSTHIFAGRDIADIALYLQNTGTGDTSIVASGRDLNPHSTNSPLRISAQLAGNATNNNGGPLAGDIRIAGPGNLQILAGRNLDLGTGANNPDGTGTGLTSIGNTLNPFLPFGGANILVAAGIGPSTGLSRSNLNIDGFLASHVLTPEGEAYLKEIAPGTDFASSTPEEQARLAIEIFSRILRDAGRNHSETGNYQSALDAIQSLFGASGSWNGNILTRSRDIRTTNGGDITIIAPGGGLELATTILGNPLSPPGIITASGGHISIFANNDVNIGLGRIFTLRGGNEIIWSSKGDIAAGSSSKTVQSAPPTRVLIDPQSAAVETDLSGLATGGGIGVLATVRGVPPGDVDLIAPEGTVDAGDAGIRVSGNLNIAANQIVNAANISVGGTSTGTPAAPSAPAAATVTAASTAAAATAGETAAPPPSSSEEQIQPEIIEPDSIITVEIIGYGGATEKEEEEEEPTND